MIAYFMLRKDVGAGLAPALILGQPQGLPLPELVAIRQVFISPTRFDYILRFVPYVPNRESL